MNAVLTDVAKVVEKFAPVLASSLLGPIGPIVSTLLETIFNVQPASLSTAITNDPLAGEKLQALEVKHKDILTQSDAQNYSTEVDDRKNAREQGQHNWIIPSIAMLFIVSFFVFIGLIMFKQIQPSADTHQMFDTLSNIACVIISYYFGSCHPQNK